MPPYLLFSIPYITGFTGNYFPFHDYQKFDDDQRLDYHNVFVPNHDNIYEGIYDSQYGQL